MKATTPPGIIDTLSLGFSVVNRQLWLLFIPLFLELSVSLAPRVTAGPVVEQAFRVYEGSLQSVQQELGGNIGGMEVESMLSETKEAAKSLSSFNLLSILLWQVPTLTGGALAILSVSKGLQISAFWPLAATIVGLTALGLLLAAVYFTAVATPIRGEGYLPTLFYARLRRNWTRLMGYYALLAFVLLAGAVVAAMLLGLVSLINQGLASLLTGLLFALALLGVLYLFFADEAIIVGDARALAAPRLSTMLVYRNYWASLGLAVLTGVILGGTHLVWQAISGTAPGILVALVGNAYISTGITAAIMMFYRDRAQALPVTSNTRTPGA